VGMQQADLLIGSNRRSSHNTLHAYSDGDKRSSFLYKVS